jgi:hypothetical protein
MKCQPEEIGSVLCFRFRFSTSAVVHLTALITRTSTLQLKKEDLVSDNGEIAAI